MSRRVVTRVVTLALGAALVLAGCDGGGEEPTTPPSESSQGSGEPTSDDPTTEETSAVATPPVVEAPTPAPETAIDDHVGAIWAARYFLDLYTYMRQTGDTSQFEAMSAPECQFCASQIEQTEKIHAEGGWIEGGAVDFDLENATAEYPTSEEPNYLVRFEMVEQPFSVYDGDGVLLDEWGSEALDVVIALQYANGGFVVSGVNSE